MAIYQFCNVEYLRQSLSAPLGLPEPGAELFTKVIVEALALAHDAFERSDPMACDLAERLLHVMNSHNSFAPPVQAVPSLVWGILMRAKLRHHLAGLEVSAPSNASEMANQLKAAAASSEAEDLAFFDEIANRFGKRGIVLYTKNWFLSTNGFLHQLIALTQRCREALQAVLLKNLSDEVGSTTHAEMRRRWMDVLGLGKSYENALTDPEQLTQAFALQNYRTGLSSLGDPSFALGSFYAIECNSLSISKNQLRVLRKLEFDESDLGYFKTHVEADEDHAGEWLAEIEKSSLTSQERLSVVSGALAQFKVRREMFKALTKILSSKA